MRPLAQSLVTNAFLVEVVRANLEGMKKKADHVAIHPNVYGHFDLFNAKGRDGANALTVLGRSKEPGDKVAEARAWLRKNGAKEPNASPIKVVAVSESHASVVPLLRVGA
jgi:hypothetical protein